MRLLRYTVPPGWEGASVKDFAQKRLGFSSRVLAQQKRIPGGVTQNGMPVFTTARLHAGDELAFALPEEAAGYPAAPLPLAVLWESGDYLIVDKPAWMPMHPSPGHDRDSLLHAVAYYYGQTGQSHRVCPLYRLDKDTSGLAALGKHRLAACAVAVEKRYFAVCQGGLSGSGTVDVPIGLEPGSKIKRACGAGQRAVTHWQAVCAANGHTLCAIRLETGRTHQIRAHFAYMGHPLAGDDLYGGSLALIGRQALHCGWLALSSPALAVPGPLTCPFPAGLRAAFPWLPPVEQTLSCLPGLENVPPNKK